MKRNLLAFVFLCCAAAPLLSQETTQLELNRPVARDLTTGDVHTFSLVVNAGDFVYGEADQQTVDVVVTVYDPEGTTVGTFDAPARGPEPFRFTSVIGGTYRIEVTPFQEEEGRYTMHVFRASPLVAQVPLWGGALVEKVDSLVEETLAQGPVAGLAIGVKQGENSLLVRGYGFADIENSVRANAETVFRIGSVTKQFTAAAIMQLVEAGKIGLDEPITTYLPDYPTQGHEVTIRHLLTHTSGIRSYTALDSFWSTAALDRTHDELLGLFKDEPFDFAPGERFLYNNSGFYLLGMIVEQASGESYADYLDAHVFGPLGLTRTTYCDERRIIPGRAEGYDAVEGELLNDVPLSMNPPGAAGALCSTVPELLAWSQALRTGRVVSRASYDQMTESGTLNDGSETGYGFGLEIEALEGHRVVAHSGGINGFVSMLAHYPGEALDVVVLSNTGGAHAQRIAGIIARWVLGIEVFVPPGQ